MRLPTRQDGVKNRDRVYSNLTLTRVMLTQL